MRRGPWAHEDESAAAARGPNSERKKPTMQQIIDAHVASIRKKQQQLSPVLLGENDVSLVVSEKDTAEVMSIVGAELDEEPHLTQAQEAAAVRTPSDPTLRKESNLLDSLSVHSTKLKALVASEEKVKIQKEASDQKKKMDAWVKVDEQLAIVTFLF